MRILKPGLLTTVQDRGRVGCAVLGVSRAGAMDSNALRLANALVGNSVDAAGLEITWMGPRVQFDEPTTIALTGAEFPVHIDGAEIGMWRSVRVAADAVLEFGAVRHGARAYLAIAGGIDVERVLGSASIDVNAALGPFGGRALREGDVLRVATANSAGTQAAATEHATSWSLDPRPWLDPDATWPILLIRGTHFDALDAASRDAMFTAEFRIAADSNRVGFRLDGAPLALAFKIARLRGV
ncbi:MAG: biotin-dependent carboxyltransferase family protein, partial [Rhodanobacteraceae bacterium]